MSFLFSTCFNTLLSLVIFDFTVTFSFRVLKAEWEDYLEIGGRVSLDSGGVATHETELGCWNLLSGSEQVCIRLEVVEIA